MFDCSCFNSHLIWRLYAHSSWQHPVILTCPRCKLSSPEQGRLKKSLCHLYSTTLPPQLLHPRVLVGDSEMRCFSSPESSCSWDEGWGADGRANCKQPWTASGERGKVAGQVGPVRGKAEWCLCSSPEILKKQGPFRGQSAPAGKERKSSSSLTSMYSGFKALTLSNFWLRVSRKSGENNTPTF